MTDHIRSGLGSGPLLVPRDYQQVGIDWLRSHKRGMLTDATGLKEVA
jgi:hypothetical protein